MSNQEYWPLPPGYSSPPPAYSSRPQSEAQHAPVGKRRKRMTLKKIYNCIQYAGVTNAIISMGVLIVSGVLINGFGLPVGLIVALALNLVTAFVQFIHGLGALLWCPRNSTDARPSNTSLIWISITTVMWTVSCILMFVMQSFIDKNDNMKHTRRDWRNGGKVYVPGTIASRVKNISIANGGMGAVVLAINLLQWLWISMVFKREFPMNEIKALNPHDR